MTTRKPLSFRSKSPQQTRALGHSFGKQLRGGEIIALSGNLGSGKTTFTKGLARALGIKKKIVSPTFVVSQSYRRKAGGSLYHFDLYRLKKSAELAEVGLPEALGNRKHVTVIEWPRVSRRLLPRGTIFVKFIHGKTLNTRHIIFSR